MKKACVKSYMDNSEKLNIKGNYNIFRQAAQILIIGIKRKHERVREKIKKFKTITNVNN